MQAGFLRWRSYWLRHQSESWPNGALQAQTIAEKMDSYPLAVLIQILTIPVRTATNERLFSALKYWKTYLRNTKNEVRLNSLALLLVNRVISLDFEQDNAEFLRKNQRQNFNHILKIFLETIFLYFELLLTVLAFPCYVLCSIFDFILTSKRKKICKIQILLYVACFV